ncbi:MAG: methyl-accepting chemotaxis protein [Cellulosilyticaceae bacterium]
MKRRLLKSYSIVLIVLLCGIGLSGVLLARTAMVKVQYQVTESALEKSMSLGEKLFEQVAKPYQDHVEPSKVWVDMIKEYTSHEATIFVKKDQVFERIASTIVDEDGNSVVGTMLDQTSKAYPSMDKGEQYIGEAKILGENYMTIYRPIKNTDGQIIGYLFMGDPTYKVDQLIATLQNTTMVILIGLSLFGVILGVLWTYWVACKIAKPLEVAAHYTEGLSRLDLSQEIPALMLTQKDEIGILGKTLANLTEALKHTIGSADQLALDVAGQASVLQTSMEAMNQGSQEISLVLDQIADGATHQAGDTQDGVLRIDELGQIVEASERQLKVLEQVTNTVNDLKNEGIVLIEALSEQSIMNQKAVKETFINTQEAKAKADVIVSAIEKIKAISSQTSLLALNASIEAARSKEDGKGFVVIASEIRKLAELSDQFTKEIEINIGALANSSMVAVKNMGNMTQEIELQTDHVRQTNEKFKGIAVAVDDALSRLGDVIEQQQHLTDKKDHMIEIMQSLSAIAEQNAAATQEVAGSIKEQSQFTENIFETTEMLSQLAQNMRDEVSKFEL